MYNVLFKYTFGNCNDIPSVEGGAGDAAAGILPLFWAANALYASYTPYVL